MAQLAIVMAGLDPAIQTASERASRYVTLDHRLKAGDDEVMVSGVFKWRA